MENVKTYVDVANLTLSQIESLVKGDTVIRKGEHTTIKSIGFFKVAGKGTFYRIALDNRKTCWFDFNATGQKVFSKY